MPKNGNPCMRHSVFQQAWQQSEVIVLDQDHRMILTCHLLHQGVSKFLIHGVVVLPVRSAKRRAGMCDVAEGPETLIGETVVISVFLLGAEPDATQRVARIIRWDLQPIMTVHCFYIGIAATMGYPGSVAGAKNRLNRCNQTA